VSDKRPIWVLCDAYDAAAYWAAEQLRHAGHEVSVATAAQLDAAVRLQHRISRLGECSVEIELADGRCVSDKESAGFLNRLSAVSVDRLQAIAGAERDYALQEMHALFLSWLHALPGKMLNRPTPQGLGGNWRHPSAWALLAGQAGLESAPYRHSERTDPDAHWALLPRPDATTVYCVDGCLATSCELPSSLVEACLALGALSGDGLIGIELVKDRDDWSFHSASPRPDLFKGGRPLVDAISRAFS
jgi:hypothetical protein